MGILLRTLGTLFVAIAAFLVYAVIHAAASAGGARVGVAIGYVIAAIILVGLATWFWRVAARRRAASQPSQSA